MTYNNALAILDYVNIGILVIIVLFALYNSVAYLCLLKIKKPLIILIYLAIYVLSAFEIAYCILMLDNQSAFELYEEYKWFCLTQQVMREILLVIIIMTAYQLTISLQLICEDFLVDEARKRKRRLWLWSLLFVVFRIAVMSLIGLQQERVMWVRCVFMAAEIGVLFRIILLLNVKMKKLGITI